MTDTAVTTGEILRILGAAAGEGKGVEVVPASDVPAPYHDLLVHERDMTRTLEAHFGSRIHLRPLRVDRREDRVVRWVELRTDDGDELAELGAIEIHLARFHDAAREEVLEARTPLGAILHEHGIAHRSRPRAFFRVPSSSWALTEFDVEPDGPLYGRYNALYDADSEPLAVAVEVIPRLAEER